MISSIISILTVVAALVIAACIVVAVLGVFGRWGTRAVAALAFIVFVLGVAVSYSLISAAGNDQPFLSLVLFSIYNAMQMFFASSTVNPSSLMAGGAFFEPVQVFKWLLSILALSITVSALIIFIGSRVSSYSKFIFAFPKKVYLIYGNSLGASLLTDSLLEKKDSLPRDGILKKNLRKFSSKHDFVKRLLGESFFKYCLLEDKGIFVARVLSASRKDMLSRDIDPSLGSSNAAFFRDDSFILKRSAGKEVKFFFFDEGEESIQNSSFEILERAKARKIEKPEVFAFTEKKWVGEIFEQKARDEKVPLEIASLHLLSAANLKARQLSKILHEKVPKEIKQISGDEENLTEIRILLLGGLGNTGCELFRSTVTACQIPGYRLLIDIVDKICDSRVGAFQAQFPEIHKTCEVEFYSFDYRCEEFRNKILSKKKEYDAIVIELGDDSRNIEAALLLGKWYAPQDGCPPVVAVAVDNSRELDVLTKNRDYLEFFGGLEQIYSGDAIVSESLDFRAKAVNMIYSLQEGSLKDDESLRKKFKEVGLDRKNFLKKHWQDEVEPRWRSVSFWHQESSRASADYYIMMKRLMNVYSGAGNKDRILSQAEKLRWNAFHYSSGYMTMSIEDMQRRFDKNVACLDEDLMNADKKASELLKRAADSATKDHKSKQHVCLVTWDELPNITIAYNALSKDKRFKKKNCYRKIDSDLASSVDDVLELEEEFLRSLKTSNSGGE